MLNLRTKQFIALTILAIGGLGFVLPAGAQNTDPVTAPAQVALGVADQVEHVADTTHNLTLEILKKVGATAYKTAGSSVMNTIAAELAKAIATGDFGGPMFSFDKEFFSSLADGVVGDLVNDIVNGALGIDLCNFDPSLTLQFSLNLPFFKEYKYEPKCSLSKISAHLQTLNAKKIFNVSSKISTKTVDSFAQIAQSIGIDPTINASIIAGAISEYLNQDNIGADSNFIANLKKDTTTMKDLISVSGNPNQIADSRNAEPDFKDAAALQKKREAYQCELAEDLYSHNLAIFAPADFSANSSHGKDLTACLNTSVWHIDKDQWPFKWYDGAKVWLTNSNRTESIQALTQLQSTMDDRAKKANFSISDAKGAKLSPYLSPIAAGMERVQTVYATCLAGLNRVLDVRVTKTTPKTRTTITKKSFTEGPLGLSGVPTIGTTPGATTDISGNSTYVVLDSNPPEGTYATEQSVKFVVVTNDTRQPVVRWSRASFDGNLAPNCDPLAPILNPDGSPHTPTQQERVNNHEEPMTFNSSTGVWETTTSQTVTTSDKFQAIACIPGGTATTVLKSALGSFNFVIDPKYVEPAVKEIPLTPKGTNFEETFLASDIPTDPNKPYALQDVYITYTQGGRQLTEVEFAACQVAFNGGALLSNFYSGTSCNNDQGANIYQGSSISAEAVSLLADNPLGQFACVFSPKSIESDSLIKGSKPLRGPDYFQGFIKYTLQLDAQGQGKGQKMRDAIKEVINRASASLIAVQEVTSTLSQQIDQLFFEGNFRSDTDEASTSERLDDFSKALEPASNEKATSSQLTKKLLDAKYKKKEEETTAALQEGSLLKSPRSAVSEQATGTSDTARSQLDRTVKGEQPGFADYTGEIFADAMNVFLQTLWNQLLIRGLSELNPGLRKSLGVDPGLEARIKEQQECKSDPTKCKTALADQQFGDASPCDTKDLDILKSVNNIGKSLGNLFTTGSGKVDGITAGCQAALDKERQDKGAGFSLTIFLSSIEGLLKTVQGIVQGIGSGQDTRANRAPSENITVAAPKAIELAQGPDSRSTDPSAFTSAFDGSPLSSIGLNDNADTYEILSEMTTCPKGQTNPNLYNCVIDGKFRSAIDQKLTINDAMVTKQLIKGDLAIGVDEKGQPPLPGKGISLAAAQKLRKARIMPIGFEYAARLKVACYEQQLLEKSSQVPAALPADYPYKDISSECTFFAIDKITGAREPVSKKMNDFLRDEVLAANFKTIIDGFNQTGGDGLVCGNFQNLGTDADPSTTMSPFCGLVNPDWVLKLPTPRCDLYEFSDILETKKGINRYDTCTELVSDLGNNNGTGYCLKEGNQWSFTGQTCPQQYATCTSYIFKDGTVDSFNKDSLVKGVCDASNAGCTWVSTVKQTLVWRDTAGITDRFRCESNGGTFDSVTGQCSNSRLYINGNIGYCSAADAGCTEVKLFKQPGGNLALDGSFESAPVDTIPSFWKVGAQSTITTGSVATTTEQDSCVNSGGQVTSVCTDVQYQDFNTCTANGGTWNETGTPKCINASLTGAVSPDQCGACSFTGTDQTANQSTRLFDQASCNAVANHTWLPGSFKNLCLQSDQACLPTAGVCSIDYSKANDNEPACLALPDGVFTSTTAGSGTCQYVVSGGTPGTIRTGLYDNDPARCASVQGTFNYSCPLFVRNQTETAQDGSTKALEINANSQDYAPDKTIVTSYPLKLGEESSTLTLAGDTFSVSFDIRGGLLVNNVLTGPLTNTTVRAELIKTFSGGRVESKTLTIPVATFYQRYSMTLTTLTNGTDLTLRLYVPYDGANGARVYVDAVKLEYNTPAQILGGSSLVSNYSDYSTNEARFVKLPPAYLGCRGFSSEAPSPKAPGNITSERVCLDNGLYWDTNNVYKGGTSCYRFAPDPLDCGVRLCRADEAGCQLYTPTNGEPSVPGVVGQQDYCPNACVGYDTFKQQPSSFEPTTIAPIAYFIPSTAKQCKVTDVGCDEFTNLSLGATANPIEYYTYLKQCIIPNTGKGDAGFFIWQGSADGPPQLKTFTLQAEGGTCSGPSIVTGSFPNDPLGCKGAGGTFSYDGTGGPAVYSADGFCTASSNDLDCLQFFDKTGKSYYRKLNYTIEADAGCQQLRKSQSDRQSCLATNGQWTSDNNCVYIALPSKSNSCTAQVSGCREYFGNTGHNQFPVSFDNFANSIGGWVNASTNDTTGLTITGESVVTLGRSLYIAPDINPSTVVSINKPVQIQTGRNYKLTFWAKNKSAATRSIAASFSTAPAGRQFVTAESNQAQVGPDWKFYEFGPVFVDWQTTDNNKLTFTGVGDIFMTNISVIALQESTYVVKNSWVTPQACDTTNLGAPMPQAQLGCQEYTDPAKNKIDLKSFAKLCRESSVGCQLVFNTYNSSNPLAVSYNTKNDSNLDDLTVPQDALTAVIINDAALCPEASKGCMEVGLPSFAGVAAPTFNQTLDILNNPDRYEGANGILCREEALGCVELRTFKGEKDYYKVDYANTCDYQSRTLAGQTDATSGWFKTNTGVENLGCSATPETTKSECISQNGVWNDKYSQCTSDIKGISFGNCTGPTFTPTYIAQLEGSCTTDFKGFWYNNGVNGCGCARNPFDYYKSGDYPEHVVSPARCEEQYDQCTEFLDFNPNYVFNGDFETENVETEGAQSGQPANWTQNSLTNGRARLESGDARSGSLSLRMTKNTVKDLPDGGSLGEFSGTLGSPFYVYQNVRRLEQGSNYELNFDFKAGDTPINSRGVIGIQDTGKCRLPEAAVEIVPLLTPEQSALFSREQTEFLNHKNIQVFEATGGWKRIASKFIVPKQAIVLPGVTNGDDCTTKYKGFFVPGSGTGATAVAPVCYTQDPSEPTIDYQVRIYGPLNGACVNNRTGEKLYFDDDGKPLDRYLCEGANATQLSIIENNFGANSLADLLSEGGHYNTYDSRVSSAGILDFDDSTAPGQGDSFHWEGNCAQSSYLIDRFQISPERNKAYDFIDNDKIQTCGTPNWDAGCIEFENVLTGGTEKFQVKPDRECAEFLYCNPDDRVGKRCTNWQTCTEVDSRGICTRPGSQLDTFRYTTSTATPGTTLLNPLDRTAYQQRVGTFEDYRINRWRAGDYDGYSIPNLPPIEQLFDAVQGASGIAADHDVSTTELPVKKPKYADSLAIPAKISEANNNWAFYDGTTPSNPFAAAPLSRVCRGYPEVTSPFPTILSNLVPGFENTAKIVDGSGSTTSIGVNERLLICNYLKYNINSQQQIYVSDNPTTAFNVCYEGRNAGLLCTTVSSASQECPDANNAPKACKTIGDIRTLASGASPDPQAQAILQKLGEQPNVGDIGVCLEEESLMKVTGGFIDSNGNGKVDQGELNQTATPHACLTFFPL